ncbi:hypothetical protein Cgig2_009494 [Carnegiea gigantea]|uniref:Uncharacterized protein n=1 Tax=Carnegiea gigantea TaxID=171969 RepID=A0A9Q1JHW5_9CARY|nr:hypothetical protein Cgig2_009494 [Carnegiea gigantea]
MGVAKGQCTETFLRAFLSCWLCMFILPVRRAGYICLVTFSIALVMTSSVGYCLPTIILASVCKGPNEISRSSHPGRGRGHFPVHFLYTWLAKNFNTYELASEASSRLGMLSHSNLKRPEILLVMGGAFDSIHPLSIDLRRLSSMTTSYQELTLLISSAFVRVLSLTITRATSSRSVTILIDLVDNLDVSTDLDFDNLPNHVLTRYGTGSQVLLPRGCNLLERNTTCAFHEWWYKMFISRLVIHMPVTLRGNEVIYLIPTFQRMKANLVLSPS